MPDPKNTEDQKKKTRGLRAVAVVVLLVALWFGSIGKGGFPSAEAQDSLPPKISNVTIGDVTATSTLITWITDEISDSLVNYGLTKNFGVVREPTAPAKEHTVLLTDLEPSTTYYFRVMSADSAGNQSFSGMFSVTTEGTKAVERSEEIASDEQRALTERISSLLEEVKDETALEVIADKVQEVGEGVLTPPLILGDPDIEVGATEATIAWNTDKEANSIIDFATEGEYGGAGYVRKEGDANEFVLEHRVTLFGLRPETVYHFQITSEPRVGPVGQSPDRTFKTKSILPEIFAIRILKIEETAATITWSTQVPAAALVEYKNLATGEEKSIGNPALQISHTIRLPDLKFRSPYQVIVKARTASGDEVVSQPLTFVTTKDEAPPIISQVNNESTLYPGADAKIQTIVNWETDEASKCQFFYGEGVAVDDETALGLGEETGFSLKHVQVITEFTPSTVYKFWISCHDPNGNPARSEDFVLFTPEKEKSIIDIILENFESTFGWVKNIGK